MATSFPALEIYCCYDPTDLDFYQAFRKHLAPLTYRGWIHLWDEQQISPGQEITAEREQRLRSADLLLLLISPDFLATETGQHQIRVALERHQSGEAITLPLLLRPCGWQETALHNFQMLPKEHKALSIQPNLDEAWQEIATEVSHVVKTRRQWVFVVSTTSDQAFVEQLSRDMASAHLVLWNQKNEKAPSDLSWDTDVRDAMRSSFVVILIASPEACNSRMVKVQLDLAAVYQRAIIVIWARGEDWDASNPGHWHVEEVLDFRTEDYRATKAVLLDRLRQSRRVLAPPEKGLLQEPRNPYKGLQAFGEKDTQDFFGRTALINEMVTIAEKIFAREKKDRQCSRLLAVIGASGSGKSSTVMAGLLPCLQHGRVFNSQEWIYLDRMVPGTHPLEALATSLSQQPSLGDISSLSNTLASDSVRTLHLLIRHLVGSSHKKVVLMIDQFEEVFTLTNTEEERQHFFDLLVTATTDSEGSLLIILTLRADFYERQMEYPAFYRLLDTHHASVLPMEREDLRQVIEQPASLPDVQLTFEDDLVGDLLFDIRGQIGALPLLEFTLDQLFMHRNGHQLTLQAYHKIGGVKGALTKHAKETYAGLPSDEHRRLAQALFARLIDPGATDSDTTRRRATFIEFKLDDPIQNRMLHETIDAFVEARLLTTNTDLHSNEQILNGERRVQTATSQNTDWDNEIAGATTLEVSHEALIREWDLLSSWIQEARKDISLQQTISDDVLAWIKLDRPSDRLYRGTQLKEAQAWAKRSLPSKNETAFLRASAARRMQNGISIAVVLLLLLATTGIAGWLLFNQSPDVKYVTNANDDGPGSLRWSIANVSNGDTITFDQSLNGKTILLKSGDLNITKNLHINGPNGSTIAISSGQSGYIISVHPKAVITIINITFAKSRRIPAFITNEGDLTLTHCIISGNDGGEGALYNDHGNLTINASTISGNTGVNGGGIDNSDGTVTLADSAVSANKADYGGGILSDGGTLTLINSMVYDNTAHSEGGGINNISGKATLISSTISNNKGIGAGITNRNGQLLLINSTISDNQAQNIIPALFPGGGIVNDGGQSSLINSTISNNLSLTGGGVFVSKGQVKITFCTIYGNNATTNGGGISVNSDNGVGLTIKNSIVANNHANTDSDISGPVISSGYNLIQNLSGANFMAPLDMHATDISGFTLADLKIDSTLRKNEGSTQTHALLVGSPAIDKIPLQYCQVKDIFNEQSQMYIDQRSVKRPDKDESACDIGAYEYADLPT